MFTRLRPQAIDLVKRFAGDRNANIAMMFGLTIVPVMLMVATTVEYSRGVKAKSALQSAMDSAVLTAVQNSNTDTSFKAANAQFCAAAQTNGVTLQNASGAAISCASTQFFTLNPGATAAANTVTGLAYASLQPELMSWPGLTAINYKVTSTAKWSNPPTSPSSINFAFQYAKGWYYKVVTLWVQETSTSAPLPLETWTYQVVNTTDVALPLSQSAVPYFWTQTGSQPSDTGIGSITTTTLNSTTTPACSPAVTIPGAPQVSNIQSVHASLACDGTISFTSQYPYYNLYLTMDVADQDCPLNQYTQSNNSAPNATIMALITANYTNNWSPNNLIQTVTCSSQQQRGQSAPLSSYSMTVSTNNATNSNYLYINGKEQPANTKLGVLAAFPCPAGATTVTNNYEWEDSNNSTSGTRDFFFSLTTACSTGVWSNAPNIPVLIN